MGRPSRWEPEMKKEEELRVAQAHEALEALRGHIAHKSYLYRTNRKLARGKRGRKSRYGKISSVEKNIRLEAKRYDLARWALFRLGAAEKYPELEELTSKDTKAVVTVWDPNAEGQRNAELSWIWKVRSSSDPKAAEEYVRDLYRVNWIRARSRRDRWKEELMLLESEMEWFVRFCKSRRERALAWALNGVTEGHRAYAYRQADMWARHGNFAKFKFKKKSGVTVNVSLGDEDEGDMAFRPTDETGPGVSAGERMGEKSDSDPEDSDGADSDSVHEDIHSDDYGADEGDSDSESSNEAGADPDLDGDEGNSDGNSEKYSDEEDGMEDFEQSEDET
ncbi:hypothetical protein NMY22_g1672 [Coprinellus aureogranulatus]|nr:hypothetical protein NMY22_g1672 [Coprinellus aureogranulatus]